MAVERMVSDKVVQAKVDDDIILDAVIAEVERANPAWRTSAANKVRDALTRRTARRGAP